MKLRAGFSVVALSAHTPTRTLRRLVRYWSRPLSLFTSAVVRQLHALHLRGQDSERVRHDAQAIKLARDRHETIVASCVAPSLVREIARHT